MLVFIFLLISYCGLNMCGRLVWRCYNLILRVWLGTVVGGIHYRSTFSEIQ